jgi:hypothetical protein
MQLRQEGDQVLQAAKVENGAFHKASGFDALRTPNFIAFPIGQF